MATIRYRSGQSLALFIVLLFHVSGVIGILLTPYRDWFVQNTPLNLLLMAMLLVLTQKEKNTAFISFFFLSCLAGFAAECIGVNTGLLFGHYRYGSVLGTKLYGVPLLIGINWFIIVCCAGVTSTYIHKWTSGKRHKRQVTKNRSRQSVSFVVVGALLATLFDFLIEPAAVKMGFWHWLDGGGIPVYNYVCWFGISAVLLTLFERLPFDKSNRLAVHLFWVQILFFLLLRVFL